MSGPTEEGDGRVIKKTELPDASAGGASPCAECPFSRSIAPGALGGSPVEVYVGQAAGPFWIPCHMALDFEDPDWKTQYGKPQCAGAAIYRANCGYAVRMPLPLLQLPADPEKVFASPEELVAHHVPALADYSINVDRFLQIEFEKIRDLKKK